MCTGWYRQQMVKSDIKYKEKWIQNYMCSFYFLDTTRKILFFFIQHHLLLLLITHILLFNVLEVFINIVFLNLPSSIIGLREGIGYYEAQFSSVQSFSRVRLFGTPWIAARQASLSITNSLSSLRLTSIESVMPSSHLILSSPSPPAPNPSQHQSPF